MEKGKGNFQDPTLYHRNKKVDQREKFFTNATNQWIA